MASSFQETCGVLSENSQISPAPIDFAAQWTLDPRVVMLNHGSFGACPRPVLEAQEEFRRQLESEPVRFFVREFPPLLDAARDALARFIGARAADVVFVRNATEGVNGVLRSLRFEPDDELLVTDHAYNACRQVVEFVAERDRAKVVVARVATPINSAEEVIDAVTGRVTDRTRLAMLDHVSSPTAMIFPVDQLVRTLEAKGVDTLVDGAHAPGMIPLNVDRTGAAYYAGNCHKWLCAPKGAGFLHVRADRQEGLHPAVISHGYNTVLEGRSRFHQEFDWTGTADPTAWLCVPRAIRFLDGLTGHGIEDLMQRNHRLAVEGSRLLRRALEFQLLCPDEMLGSMAAVGLPDDDRPPDGWTHPLQSRLFEQFSIEVPVFHWPAPPRLLLRISAQAYNHVGQYEQLAASLEAILKGPKRTD